MAIAVIYIYKYVSKKIATSKNSGAINVCHLRERRDYLENRITNNRRALENLRKNDAVFFNLVAAQKQIEKDELELQNIKNQIMEACC